MAHIHLDDLLALGAGGTAGMVILEGRYLGVLGEGNLVELDEDNETFVAEVRARRGMPALGVEPAKTPRKPRTPKVPVEVPVDDLLAE